MLEKIIESSIRNKLIVFEERLGTYLLRHTCFRRGAGRRPVLLDNNHYQIALSLDGIGTGTVSLVEGGELRDWETMNIPGKKYSTVTPGEFLKLLPTMSR